MKTNSKKGVLWRSRVYLTGAMQYTKDGRSWREKITDEFKKRNIITFDPYHKPFINKICEDEQSRKQMQRWMNRGEYDLVLDRMKHVRSDDLRLCDISDFNICYIDPQIHTAGTYEELVQFTRCKKPIFLIVKGGKKKCPLWILGMIPHKYIYGSVGKCLKMIKDIDDGKVKIDSDRWRLLKYEYR